MASKFPVFKNHASVICFNCDDALVASEAVDSGFPPKHGAFKKPCPRCQMNTWYDLVEGGR